jgi:GLPGLI family protein
MKNIICILSFFLLFSCIKSAAQRQRIIAECTIKYTIKLDSNNVDKTTSETIAGNSKTVYIKGNHSRVDVVSPTFNQSVFYDQSTGGATVLREIGNNKFITKLDKTKWKLENNKYDNPIVTYSSDVKNILGYTCKKAILTYKSGEIVTLYVTSEIAPSVKEFEYQFKDISGFVMEYETLDVDGLRINYTAMKIDLSPVQSSIFNIPTSGYRMLN